MLETIKKFLPQNFNDFLAVALILIIPVLWALQARGILPMPAEVVGALIATWTLIIQFYFRKAQSEQ